MKCSLGISHFLEEISSLSHSVVFLYFFALIERKAFLSLLTILWNSAFKWVYLSFSPLPLASLFSFFVRPHMTTILPFSISFSWAWCQKNQVVISLLLFNEWKLIFFYDPLPCWPRQFLKIPIIPAPTPWIETFMSGACCASCSGLLWRGQIPCC